MITESNRFFYSDIGTLISFSIQYLSCIFVLNLISLFFHQEDIQSSSGNTENSTVTIENIDNNNNPKETNLDDDPDIKGQGDDCDPRTDETSTRYVCVKCGDKEVPVFRETTV